MTMTVHVHEHMSALVVRTPVCFIGKHFEYHYPRVNLVKCNVSLRGDRAYRTIVTPDRIPYHSKFFMESHFDT